MQAYAFPRTSGARNPIVILKIFRGPSLRGQDQRCQEPYCNCKDFYFSLAKSGAAGKPCKGGRCSLEGWSRLLRSLDLRNRSKRKWAQPSYSDSAPFRESGDKRFLNVRHTVWELQAKTCLPRLKRWIYVVFYVGDICRSLDQPFKLHHPLLHGLACSITFSQRKIKIIKAASSVERALAVRARRGMLPSMHAAVGACCRWGMLPSGHAAVGACSSNTFR